jgi:hypothetical protein
MFKFVAAAAAAAVACQVDSITVGAPGFPTATLPGSDQQPLHLMVKPGLYAAAAVEAGAMLAAVPLSLSLPLRPDKLRVSSPPPSPPRLPPPLAPFPPLPRYDPAQHQIASL